MPGISWAFALPFALFLGAPARGQDAPAGEGPKPAAKTLTVLFHGGFHGRFSEVSCSSEPVADMARVIAAVDAVRTELSSKGRPPPVVLNPGNNISPHAFAGYALSRGRPGGALLAGLLKRVGYDSIAFGNLDFYAHGDRMRTFFEGVREANLPLLASNLGCADPKKGFCPDMGQAVGQTLLFERDGVKIGVFSLLPGNLATLAAHSQLEGLTVREPLEYGPVLVSYLRKWGADVVVALVYTERAETTPREVLTLARALNGADLVITDSFQRGGPKRAVETVRFEDGASTVLGCGHLAGRLCRAELSVEPAGSGWRVGQVQTTAEELKDRAPDPDSQALLTAEVKDYCQKRSVPLGKGLVEEPLDSEGFANYLMEIMRHQTRSELAFINRHLVDPSVFPFTGAMTGHKLYTGISYQNELYTFELTGDEVQALCTMLDTERGQKGGVLLLSRGLSCGSPAEVNERPITSQDRYRAVTIGYLAQGMLGYFARQSQAMTLYQPRGEVSPPPLGAVAESFFKGPRFSGPGPVPIALTKNFPDLAERLRWTLEGEFNFNLVDTEIGNTPYYWETQLNRQEFLSLNGELRGRIAATGRAHWLSFDLRSKLSGHSIDHGDFAESEDLTVGEAVYTRNLLPSRAPRWYVPNPFIGVKVETELTRPTDDPTTAEVYEGRDYHYMEVTGTLGARLTLLPTLDFKLGAGVRREIFAPEARFLPGLELGYNLLQTFLLQLERYSVLLEGSSTLFFGDLGRDNIIKGNWFTRMYVSLFGPLYFTVTHELFLYRMQTDDLAFASDLTFGLSLHGQTAFQTF